MGNEEEEQQDSWLSFEDAAHYLNISKPTMTRRVKNKELVPRYKGASRNKWFPKDELDEYIKRYQAKMSESEGEG